MGTLSSFCTCTDLACPLHPTNHDKGCAPCISKNLRDGEIPSCFFKSILGSQKPAGYGYEDFAQAVLAHREGLERTRVPEPHPVSSVHKGQADETRS